MPNLLPGDMRDQEKRARKGGDGSDRKYIMHLPEDSSRSPRSTPPPKETKSPQPAPPAPPKKEQQPSPTPPATPPQPPRPEPPKAKKKEVRLLRQSADVLQEQAHPGGFFSRWRRGKSAKSAKNGSLNLIAPNVDTVVGVRFWENVAQLFGVLLVMLIIIFGTFAAIKLYQIRLMKEVAVVENQITSVEQEIGTYRSDQTNVIKLQSRAEALQGLLANHVYWTQFLRALEEQTLPTVFYTTMVSDFETGVRLEAYAPSYEDLAKQLVAFESTDSFSSVEILAGRLTPFEGHEEELVSFNVSLELHDRLLKQQNNGK